MKTLYARTISASVRAFVGLGFLIFLSAGTLHYWQGWAFLATFIVCSVALTIYLALYDEKLLERRLRVGPKAETEASQKIIMMLMLSGFAALLVFPVLDHRFAWSPVPPYVSIIGDALIALGYLFMLFVLREN